MTNHRLKLITTQDGSHSLMREDMNETYHSFHGAVGESSYVFIEKGLEWCRQQESSKEIGVFEVGFGTGLNAYLAAKFAMEKKCHITFHSVEPIPVSADLYAQFNYGKTSEDQALLQKLHEAKWGELAVVHSHFSLAKHKTTLEAFHASRSFDVIFFDAFAPNKQSEVWSLSNLQKCFDMTNTRGCLTTYCAQGQFKRNLAAAGYEVETLKGAMGKKEMVRGIRK